MKQAAKEAAEEAENERNRKHGHGGELPPLKKPRVKIFNQS